LYTVGELADHYEEDLTVIRGIGPSRAYDLVKVLAAAGYPSSLDTGAGQDAGCRWSPCRSAGTAGGCGPGCTGADVSRLRGSVVPRADSRSQRVLDPAANPHAYPPVWTMPPWPGLVLAVDAEWAI
jgi:hypothetical protein